MQTVTITFSGPTYLFPVQIAKVKRVMSRYNPVIMDYDTSQELTLDVDPDLNAKNILLIGMLLQACIS